MFCYCAKSERHSFKDELANPVFVRVVLIEPLDCAIDQWITKAGHTRMCSNLYAYDNIRIRVLLAYGMRM